MDFVTAATMKELELRANSEGVSYDAMMVGAGNKAADIILGRFSVARQRVLVLCGKGNNGGDGFVVAQRLFKAGGRVTVLLWQGQPATDTAQNAFKALSSQVRVVDASLLDDKKLLAELEQEPPALLVDALYGAGYRGGVSPRDAALFHSGAFEQKRTVALDLPSGVEADTGKYTTCLPCALCVAMGYYKPAHLMHWSKQYAMETVIATFPLTSNTTGCVFHAIGPEDAPAPRIPWSHKGTNGRLGLICGSRQFPGAAILAASSALRAGVGYVRLISTQHVCDVVASHLPEVIYTPCKEDNTGALDAADITKILAAADSCDALVIGCGLTQSPSISVVLKAVLTQKELPVILDADALNCMAQEQELLKQSRCRLLVTPHPGEFSRLFGVHIHDIEHNACALAQTNADDYNITVLLKGPMTVISAPNAPLAASFGGNSGLAKGGSGDVLAGILGAMAARGLKFPQAAYAGAWLHGEAARLACAEKGENAMLPSDVALALAKSF